MTMTLIADAPVDVDAEGFLTDPTQWNEQIAEAIDVCQLSKVLWVQWVRCRCTPFRTLTAP